MDMANKRIKTRSVTAFIPEELEEKVEVIKLRPGGITKLVEDAIRACKVTDDELAAVRLLHRSSR